MENSGEDNQETLEVMVQIPALIQASDPLTFHKLLQQFEATHNVLNMSISTNVIPLQQIPNRLGIRENQNQVQIQFQIILIAYIIYEGTLDELKQIELQAKLQM